MSLEDVGPELSLWLAVVAQLVEDALDFAKHGDDRHGYRLEAHIELNRPGPMLQRLCGLAGVDQALVLDSYRRKARGVQMSRALNPRTALPKSISQTCSCGAKEVGA